MKMKKFLSLATALVLTFSLAACGGGSASTAGSPSGAGSTAGATGQDGSKKVELLTWTNEPTVLYLQSIADAFHQAYPEYTLVVSNIPSGEYDAARETRISAGNVDIVSFQTFAQPQEEWNKNYVDKPVWQQYIDEGLLVDLTNEEFMKNYDLDILKGNSYNDKYYSISQGTVAYTGLFYNKAIFKELNLEVPQTWEEFIALCETVKNSGKYSVMTTGAADQWPLNMYANAIISANFGEKAAEIGKKLLTGEMLHTDKELEVVYQSMEEFASYLEPGVTGVNYSDAPGRFAAGNMALYADGAWTAPTIAEANPELEFGYFSLPGKEKRADGLVTQYGIKYDLSFSVPSNAPNKEGALAFLEYFSRKEVYTEFLNKVGGFSSTQSGITLESEFMNSLAPGLEKPNLNPELLMYDLKGVGEYGASRGFSFFFLDVLGGPFTPRQLAEAAAADYATAREALAKVNG